MNEWQGELDIIQHDWTVINCCSTSPIVLDRLQRTRDMSCRVTASLQRWRRTWAAGVMLTEHKRSKSCSLTGPENTFSDCNRSALYHLSKTISKCIQGVIGTFVTSGRRTLKHLVQQRWGIMDPFFVEIDVRKRSTVIITVKMATAELRAYSEGGKLGE